MKGNELTKIIGSPSDIATTQIHDFDLPEGKLVILVTAKREESNITRMETIRGVVNFLHHEASSNFSFDSFKTEIEKSVSNPPFDLLVVCVREKTAYVFALGEVSCYLLRDKKEHSLIKGSSKLHSVSGKLNEGDTLILGTNTFFEIVSVTSISEYSSKNTVHNLEPDFETAIDQSEDRGQVGGAVLLTGANHEEEVVSDIKQDDTLEEEVSEAEDEEPLTTPWSPSRFKFKNNRFFVRGSSVYEAHGKSKRMTAIGGVLLVLLSIGIFFGLRAKKDKDEAALVSRVITDAKESLSQARAISLVNKNRARELIYSAQSAVLGVSTKEEKYPEVKGMKAEINESLGDVGGIYEVTPDTFSDLTLVTGKMSADEMSLSDEVLTVLGREERRIITIALSGKRTETVSGSGSYNNPTKIASYSGRTFVWESNGINEYGGNGKGTVTPTVSPDNGLVSAFAGNLYVIDKSANQIWRFSGGDNGFGAQNQWLANDVTVDLSKTTSMAIDGSIWTLSESGKITKFTLGNPQGVTVQGLDNPLSEKSKLFTSDEQKYLYILDPSQKSVYVFEKSGEFVAKYENEALLNCTNLIVSESQRIMVLASGPKLLSLPLKHLK